MKVVIITTINSAEGLYKIKERCPGWVPIVAGDLRTPHDTNKQICKEVGGVYLDPETQMKLGFTHAAAIPWNCYGRKNVAYLFALKEGAQLFYITDDDNIPTEDWAEHVQPGWQNSTIINSQSGWYNCYEGADTGDAGYITPRGYPSWLMGAKNEYIIREDKANIGVIAGLPLGSPDVDAVTRLAKNPFVRSYPDRNVVLDKGTMCPYDTQNTIIVRDLMPANMLWSYPADCSTGKGWVRFDDICAGYVGQVIAWKYGYRVRFGRPFATQDRNQHDILTDLLLEVDGMHFQRQFVDTLINVNLKGHSPVEDLQLIIHALLKAIPSLPRCLRIYVDTWANDLRTIGID